MINQDAGQTCQWKDGNIFCHRRRPIRAEANIMKTPHFLSLLIASLFQFAAPQLRADDHGDTLASASAWNGPDISGNLELATDEDWFRFTITVPGQAWIYSSGSTDTTAFLYDSGGNQHGNDYDHGSAYNFEIHRILSAGTYYLRVLSGDSILKTGAYTVHLRSPQFATEFNTPNLNAALDGNGEIDLYRIIPPAAGRAWFYAHGNVDTEAWMFNDRGDKVASDYDHGVNGNFRFTLVPSAGDTYYLMVRSGDSAATTGGYTLCQRLYSNALPLGTTHAGSLENGGDLDLYRLEVGRAGLVWIYTTGSTDTDAWLYTPGGAQEANDYGSGPGTNFQIGKVLAAGTYYLLVEGGGSAARIGDYQLEVRQAATAEPLTAGTSARSIGVPGDLDFFTFNSSGGVTLSSTGTTDTVAALFNKGGSQLAIDYDSNGGGNFRINRTLAADVYYLLVYGETKDTVTGTYTLNMASTGGFGSVAGVSATSLTADGGNHAAVTVTGSAAWTLTGLPAWAGASSTGGTGPGTVDFTFQPNQSGQPRTALVNVAGITVALTQPAAAVHLTGAGLTIADAVILTLLTTAGTTYAIESSTDLQTWTATGITVNGDGSAMEFCMPRAGSSGWFRAVAR